MPQGAVPGCGVSICTRWVQNQAGGSKVRRAQGTMCHPPAPCHGWAPQPPHTNRAAPSSPARSPPVGRGCDCWGAQGTPARGNPCQGLTCSAWRWARSWHSSCRRSCRSRLQHARMAQLGPEQAANSQEPLGTPWHPHPHSQVLDSHQVHKDVQGPDFGLQVLQGQ